MPIFRTVSRDNKGKIWLAGKDGLFTIKNDSICLPYYSHPLFRERIDHLSFKGKNLWLATKENGVLIKRGTKVFQVTMHQGLSTDHCTYIVPLTDSSAWIASSKGINKILIHSWHPFRISIKHYTSQNGLISDEVNQIALVGSTLYFAHNKGVSWFDEKDISQNTCRPPIYISSVKINHKVQPLQEDFNLPYNKNTFTIHYTGLSYKKAGHVRYKYRMKGLSEDWLTTYSTRASFYALPYGEYDFEVLAQNNDGYWGLTPSKIHFSIAPPIWHTWWFRILGGLLIFTSLYLFIRKRIQKIEKRASEKEALYKKATEMEMKFLTSQMNPHFTFNAMNSIQHFLMDNETEKAEKYLVKYSRLIRLVLEHNMEEKISIASEINLLKLYTDIEKVRFQKEFEFDIQISNEIDTEVMEIPPMFLQPYIENAIWHGLSDKTNGIGKITVNFSFENDQLKVVIEDNGIGREKAKQLKKERKEHKSYGLLITQKRMLHFQSEIQKEPLIEDLKNEAGEGIGTRVILFFNFE